MKAAEGKIGRVFVIRLEEGDLIPTCLEDFARENSIEVGLVTLIGGIGEGNIVTGPRSSDKMPPDAIITSIVGVHEVLGTGLIARDKDGNPVLHIHGAFGRDGEAMAGCMRPGVKTWLVGEAVILEITGTEAKRIMDKKSGFVLLEPK